MSLGIETPAEQATSTASTAGQLYMEYAVGDIKHFGRASDEVQANPFFRASLELVAAWSAIDRLPTGEEVPELQIMLEKISELPRQTTSHIFYRNILLSAFDLVANRGQDVDPDLHQTVYINATERALDLRDIMSNHHRDQQPRFQHMLSNAMMLALANRKGFAMQALPHRLMNNFSLIHSGTLLKRGDRTLNQGQRFQADFNCAGFADGHDDVNPAKARGKYPPSVRLVSLCCDLKFSATKGHENIDRVLDALERDINPDDNPPVEERRDLDKLSDHIIHMLVWNKNRNGLFRRRK